VNGRTYLSNSSPKNIMSCISNHYWSATMRLESLSDSNSNCLYVYHIFEAYLINYVYMKVYHQKMHRNHTECNKEKNIICDNDQ
jgi:hypothetical protein